MQVPTRNAGLEQVLLFGREVLISEDAKYVYKHFLLDPESREETIPRACENERSSHGHGTL